MIRSQKSSNQNYCVSNRRFDAGDGVIGVGMGWDGLEGIVISQVDDGSRFTVSLIYVYDPFKPYATYLSNKLFIQLAE